MSDGLGVQIRVDTNGAEKGAKKVEDSLADTEKQAEQLDRRMRTLSSSFASLNTVMQARSRASQIHAEQNNRLAHSFAGVAMAIEREKRMLVSIRGDMDAYQRDVQTLDAMMKRGAITANEYAAALARSRAAAGMGNPMDAVSLPGAAKKTPTQSFGTTAMRGAMASGVVGFGIVQAASLGDEYTNLRNRLRQVTDGHAELETMMERVSEVASNTRSDISTTGESFVRLMFATKQMGLSQERGIKITETLNMALQSSGASTSEAAAGTLQLMQAMSAGALQGDEFRSIAENIPVLMDVLSKQLGVTRGELKKMGAEGKITTEIMIKALEQFGPEAKKTFEESEQTFGQFMTGMKNEVKEFLGGGVSVNRLMRDRLAIMQDENVAWLKNAAAAEESKEATSDFTEAIGLGREVGDTFNRTMEMATIKVQEFGDAEAQLVLTAMDHFETGTRVSKMLAEQLTHMENLRKEVQRLASIDPWGDNRTGWTKWRERIGDKIKFGLEDISERTDKHTESVKEATAEQERWNEQLRKWAELADKPLSNIGDGRKHRSTFEGDAVFYDSATDFSGIPTEFDAGLERRMAQMRSPGNNLTEMWKRELEEMQRANEEFARAAEQTFQGIAQNMIDAAFSGGANWNEMLRSITLNLIKLGAMRAMQQGGMDSSFLGGLRLPGFASGGSFMVGGSGGTDTTPVAFMATKGERVTVETQAQQAESGDGGTRVIHIHLDERDALRAIDTPEGEKLIVKVMRKANKVVRGHTTGAG